MPDIQMTRQTNLRGTALQNAVTTMVQNMSRRSPFNMVTLQSRWESATRMTLSASPHVSGTIDIRDGSPSTVTANVDLLSSTARMYRGTVESAMVEESDRALQPVAGSAATATPASTQTSTQTGARRSSTSSADSWAQWSQASGILGDIFGGAAAGLDAFNQQMGYTAAQEAVQIAAQEAQNVGVSSGKVAYAPPPAPSVVRTTQAQTVARRL